MPKTPVISCLSRSIKEKIMPFLTEEERDLLKHVALCDEGNVKIGRGKRALSKYQEHMSACMKGGGDFKGCVSQWKK